MALIRRTGRRPSARDAFDLTPSLRQMMSEFDPWFERATQHLMPTDVAAFTWSNGYPADLFETDDDVVLEMAVPGMDVNDINVHVEGRQLTVEGNLPEVTDGEKQRYWLQSIPRGEFRRTMTLPSNVDVESVHAHVKDGMLTLRLPKTPESRSRKIDIKVD
jgi:HSP20 family protein